MIQIDKRTRKVTVRFSEHEYARYLSVFERIKNEYTQSQFIRDCIFSTVPPELIVKKATIFKPTACDKERIRQISGLTSNMNQISKNLNMLMKSSNKTKLLFYLKKLDEIHNYCELAMYERK